jgi:hypothetical protein
VIDLGSRTYSAGSGQNAKLVLDATTLSAGLNGKTIKPIEVTVCNDGVRSTMWVLGTVPVAIPA